MRVTITFEVDAEAADPSDSTGLTEEAFMAISEALSGYGDDIEITKDT